MFGYPEGLMLVVHSVSKRFGGLQAVLNVSFELRRGEVVGLLGPNGAGKTTTIRMISGYVPPDSGRVAVDGHDTLSDSLAARRALGYLPESAPLYGEMRTVDYLDFRARLFGLSRRPRRAAIDRVVERCWLGEVRHRRVGKLSKGYKQRVGLAAAMLHTPGLLILDEPTNGLDPTQIRETRGLIRELGQDHTVLLSSHVLPEVEMACDRVIVLARGEVRADERLDDLVARRGGTALLIEMQDAPGGAEEGGRVLARAGGVVRVERLGVGVGWSRWRVVTEPGGDAREGVARAAASAGLLVRELHRESASLERLFGELIVSRPGDNEVTAAHAPPAPEVGR